MICLFIFSLSSWFSLRILYLPKDLSISSWLSILLAFHYPLYFCAVCCNFSFYIFNFIDLNPSPFLLLSLARGLLILFIFLKRGWCAPHGWHPGAAPAEQQDDGSRLRPCPPPSQPSSAIQNPAGPVGQGVLLPLPIPDLCPPQSSSSPRKTGSLSFSSSAAGWEEPTHWKRP